MEAFMMEEWNGPFRLLYKMNLASSASHEDFSKVCKIKLFLVSDFCVWHVCERCPGLSCLATGSLPKPLPWQESNE